MRRVTKIGAGVATGAAALLAATAIAAATSTSASADEPTPNPSASAGASESSSDSHTGRPNETPLTGADAEKATAAAEAAVEGGTVLRVETDSDGVYEAHVRKSDGTEVVVKMDKDFTVTGVEEFTGHGEHGGPGHQRGADGDQDDDSSAAPSTSPSTSA